MKNYWFWVLLLVATLSVTGGISNAATVQRVIDGDTFVLESGEKVRILGIDAPEDNEPATSYLRSLIAGQEVELLSEGKEKDIYGRRLSHVFTGSGADIGAAMVKAGYAMAYLKYPCSSQEWLLSLEVEARRAGIGMWAGHLLAENTAPIEAGASTIPVKSLKATRESSTVYVTKSGKKYHSDGCRYLRKSKIPMSLTDAVAGYGACGKCSPPRLNASKSSKSKSSATIQKSGDGRCAAITKKGSQCKRKSKSGSSYCWQHAG